MNDCVSCGLLLPAGAATCPACGTSQALELAAPDQARCALHAAVVATGTCSRCGRFMCVECAAVDVGVCRSCFDSSRRDVLERLGALNVRLGWLAVAQGAAGAGALLQEPSAVLADGRLRRVQRCLRARDHRAS